MSIQETNLQSQANKEKSESGTQNARHVEALLKSLQEHGIISNVEIGINVKKHGFEYPKEYLANYLIKTCGFHRKTPQHIYQNNCAYVSRWFSMTSAGFYKILCTHPPCLSEPPIGQDALLFFTLRDFLNLLRRSSQTPKHA